MGSSRLAVAHDAGGHSRELKHSSVRAFRHAPPKISPLLMRWFLAYAPYFASKHLHSVRVSGEENLPAGDGLPLVIYMNHPSWWDPMIAAVLARRYFPARQHYAPIDSEALKKYKFFAKLGMFGVEAGSFASHRKFLDIGEQLLQQPNSALWVTAQGRFADPRERPLRLSSGLAHLLARIQTFAVIPAAVEYAFWEERTAEGLIRFGKPMLGNAHLAPSAWMNSLTDQLARTMDQLAADSIARNTARFTTILSGGAGVGGVYDIWRSFKARLRGQTFHAEHGEK